MKLSHLALRISDPARSVEFYQRLGFNQSRELALKHLKTTLIFMEGGNGLELELVHNRENSHPPEIKDGFLHLGLRVQGMEVYLEKLSGFGIKPLRPVFTTPDGMKICFLTDPDGYQLELTEPPQP